MQKPAANLSRIFSKMTAFRQHPQGFQLFFRHWTVKKPKAGVVLVHGLGEHTGRYSDLASFFQSHSLEMLGADFPGFGQSSGKRGVAPGLDTYYLTIQMAIDEMRQNYPGIPIFLFGQSMGANLALNYVLKNQPDLAGVIATSPWIRLKKMPPAPVMTLARVMRRIYPGFTQSNGLNPEEFTRSTEVIEAFRRDPHTHDQIAAGIGFALLEAGLALDSYEGTFPCPLLLSHGTADALTDPEATEAFAQRVQGPITLRLWEGLYHETYHEPEKEEVLKFLVNWIAHHVN